MNLRIEVDSSSVVNYAIQQNKKPVISCVRIYNDSADHLAKASLKITAVPEKLCLPFRQRFDLLPGNSMLELKNEEIKLLLDNEYLASLSEKVTAALQFSVCRDDENLYSHCQEITVLPPCIWHGSHTYPELLAAFVMPNHDMVAKLNKRASEILKGWSGRESLTGYYDDPNRAYQTGGAIYEAIREQQITYAVAPAGFERTGQRIRLIHEVMGHKLGNCMEMTMLYASCLEAAGLHPFLILQEGHIFLGFWLENRTFPNAVFDKS